MRPNRTEDRHKMIYCVLWAWIMVAVIPYCQGTSYTDATKLIDDKFGSDSGYRTTVRPVLDQTKSMKVEVTFDMVAIVEIDAIEQKFVVNGFLGLYWNDEIVPWNGADYQHIYFIHPEPRQIWRPRLVLTNTLDARDLFEDDYSPVFMVFDGNTSWHPGSLFPVSCKLDLYKYPFDQQDCHIQLYSNGWTMYELYFVPRTGKVGLDFYTISGEWEIKETQLTAFINPLLGLPYFNVQFRLQRLPGFFIVNIVIPIVLMSFLNILVFLIPVDSGEKISYGITVLLALTVFMSIVSNQLPRTSDTLPLVTIYLLVLTVISVCTVIMSIIIVCFHHREEKEVKHQKAVSGFKSLFRKVNLMNRTNKNFVQIQVKPANPDRPFSNPLTLAGSSKDPPDSNTIPSKNDTVFNVFKKLKENRNQSLEPPIVEEGNDGGDNVYVNRWRQFGKHIDCISFIVFTIIWISVTVGFLVEIAR